MRQIVIVGCAALCLILIVLGARFKGILAWILAALGWLGVILCNLALQSCQPEPVEIRVLENPKGSRLWIYQDFAQPFPAFFIVDTRLCREMLYLPPAQPIELRRSSARPCDIIPFKVR